MQRAACMRKCATRVSFQKHTLTILNLVESRRSF